LFLFWQIIMEVLGMDDNKDITTGGGDDEPVAEILPTKRRRKRRQGPIGRKMKQKGHPKGAVVIVVAPTPNSGNTDTAARSLDLSSGAEDGEAVHGTGNGGTEDGTVDSDIGAMDSDAQDDEVDHGGALKDGADEYDDDDDGEDDDIDHTNAAVLDELDLEWSENVLPPTSRNMAIAYLYIHVHQAADPNEWGKPGGVMAQIKNTLQSNDPDTSIEAVLRQVWVCHQTGVVYNGETSLLE
jgi:hypothetical protein